MSEPNSIPLARFIPDTSTGDDVLDTDRQALPIALLVDARSVRPPLCVGIFGGEGSGVTFFLRRIAWHVDSLSAAQVTRASADETAFCSALQITYNPWHYVGANQWLALAERIFEALQNSMREGSNADEREDLLWRIGTAGKLLREFESKREAALRVVNIEQAALHRTEEQYADAVRTNAEQQSQSHQSELNDRFAAQAVEKGFAEDIDRAGERLGLKQLSRNAAGLRRVLAQGKTPMGRASLLTSTLTAQRHIGNVVLLLLVGLLIGGASWILASMYSEMHDVGKWVEAVQNGLGALATVGTFFVVVIALMLGNHALTAVDTLQQFARPLDDIVAAITRRRRYDKLVAGQREAALLRQVEDGRDRVAEAQRNLGLAEQAIAELRSGGVQRAVIDAYRGLITAHQDVQPSLVPMIREDFEALSRFLLEPRTPGVPDVSRPERIIIYIDDLDRCPPAAVVDVIQAVQLILAFPIFVVVIGANPSSLLWALGTWYSDRRMESQEGTISTDTSLATSGVGTLAKFIHVPFWMRPLTSEGAVRLVRDMAPPPIEAAPAPAVLSPPAFPSEAMPPAGTVPMLAIAGAEKIDVVTDVERAFLESVAAALSRSLRDVKRLANCYRILRATLTLGELRSLTTDDAAHRGYLAAITQLAIVIAAPLSAPRYVELLKTAARLDDLMAALAGDDAISQRERDVILAVLELYRRSAGTNDVDGLRAWIEMAARHSFTVPPAMAAQSATVWS